jgi:predicted porin
MLRIALAALAATGAFAQNVTIGGNFDQTVYSQGSGAGLGNGWIHNGNSTSLWTMSGSEDLGGGMKAAFSLTSELNLMKGQVGSSTTGPATVGSTGAATTGAGDLFNRGANVSLSGSAGTVTVGRQTDAWFAAQGMVNTSGSNSFGFGNLTSYVSNAGTTALQKLQTAATVTGGLADYQPNVFNAGNTGTAADVFAAGVGYTTPMMSGFQANVQSLVAEYNYGGRGAGVAGNLTYANGPLKLVAGTTQKNDSTGSVGWINTVYGGSYNMGAHTFILGINKTSFSGAAAALDNYTITSLGWNYVVSPAVDMNVAYGTLVDDTNSANKATQLGVTARYKLSARTSVYAGLGNVKNEGNFQVNAIYGGGGTIDKDATTNSWLMGLKHTF